MLKIKKLFRETNLTWSKIIIFAIVAGVYTGIIALLPFVKDTSFADISISPERWILFGIFIILNSKSPLDSGLKCFIFFLISQPLVYLVQVPFYEGGWSIFTYYKYWFEMTLYTFPMGFIGYYIKKDKWWGLLILTPMMGIVGIYYAGFLSEVITCFPYHLLSAVFCAVTVLLYPAVAFENKNIKRVGLLIAVVILTAASVAGVIYKHEFYSTDILQSSESGEVIFDDSYTASLENEAYGKVSIVYSDKLNSYKIHADFKRPGTTKLILRSPEGKDTVYNLTIKKDTYELTPVE